MPSEKPEQNVVSLPRGERLGDRFDHPNTRESNKRSPVDKAHRRSMIINMRASGMTLEQIAEHMGISTPTVSRILKAALNRDAERDAQRVEQLRELELMRLDTLQTSLWARAIKGDVQAHDRVMKIMDRRAKLVGLDAPQKIERKGTMEHIHLDLAEVKRLEQLAFDVEGTAEDVTELELPETVDAEEEEE